MQSGCRLVKPQLATAWRCSKSISASEGLAHSVVKMERAWLRAWDAA
jgi:hypothetical protein